MVYKEITGTEFWKPENENDQIEGKLVRVEEGNFGELFILKTPDGERALPNLTALTTKLKKLKMEDQIRITFVGNKTGEKSGRQYKDFKLELDE